MWCWSVQRIHLNVNKSSDCNHQHRKSAVVKIHKVLTTITRTWTMVMVTLIKDPGWHLTHFTLYTFYMLNSSKDSWHFTLYKLQFTHYTHQRICWHFTLCTLHFTISMHQGIGWHFTLYKLHFAHYTHQRISWHFTLYNFHASRDILAARCHQ